MDKIKEMIGRSLFISRAGNAFYMAELPMLKINANYFQYIIAIVSAPGITQDLLKEKIPLHPSNISRAISYLEQKGFISRVPHESDRRTSRIYPTEKATVAAQKAYDVAQRWHNKLTDGLSDEDIANFYRIIEQLYVNADKYMNS